jgi:hypothetical protein
MTLHKAIRYMCYAVIIWMGALFSCLSWGSWSSVFAEDTLEVKRDKEKTVYSIGSDDKYRKEEAAERDRAWDMLRNMTPIIDGRQVRPPKDRFPQPPK